MYKNVLEYLEQSAACFPEKTAVSDENNRITYRELLQNAKAVGTWLKRCQSRNRPIAVAIDRSLESIVLFMGVLYSGNFYVPLDLELPGKRIASILETTRPPLVLCQENNRKHAEEKVLEELRGKIAVYEEMITGGWDDEFLKKVRDSAIDMDPVYCIFTSGSTGIPKGVVNSHRGVITLLESFEQEFEFSGDDTFGNQAPFDFDVSAKDIFNTLRYGGTMEIIPKHLFSYPIKLISYVKERRISVAFWAVAVLCIVANLKGMKRIKPECLRMVLFSGEVLPVKILNYWMDSLPATLFVNLYGPTEITCNCTFYKVERKLENTETLPIGKAFANRFVFLLDDQDHVCRQGKIGELCVGGGAVALGYYNQPEKTAEVFVQNPANPWYQERIYRTGDLAYEDEAGNFIYLSRKDFQIKHMGHRIELPEIETAVNALEYIHSCCCLYQKETEKLVLFYGAEEECSLQILEDLKELLPRYMLPNRLIHKKALPRNSHGKIDRKLLEQEM